MAYFANFPKIIYNGTTARNIILKSALVSEVFANASSFYPYVIKEGYRADMVANEQYGNPTLDWVVYFSNMVSDPYYDWPLSGNDLDIFLQKKYGVTKYELMSTTGHYEYTGLTTDSSADIARKSWKMSVDTFNNLDTQGRSGWSPVSIYDYETRLNDQKRSIQLLSPIYLTQITNELSRIFQ
jgi:hypothetical protein